MYARTLPIVGRIALLILRVLGLEIPKSVKIGKNFDLPHGGFGVVVHPNCTIGNNVMIFQGVTLGRADSYRKRNSRFTGIDVADDVIIGAGAKVLGQSGTLRIAAGSIIAANAVLLQSTQEREVWAGVPARRVGLRPETDE